MAFYESAAGKEKLQGLSLYLLRNADNGREFAYHEEIARELTAEGFFAHPYHSWERGLNENTNGLIRQYVPKGKDIDDLSDEDVAEIIEKINMRPRKCLGFKTPNQLFLQQHQLVALAS